MKGRGLLMGAFAALVLSWTTFAFAQTASLGHRIVSEKYDKAAQTYTLTLEVWSSDREAQEMSLQASTEASDIHLQNASKTWKEAIPRGKRLQHAVAVHYGSTKETRPVVVEIQRRSGDRTDTKKVTVMVSPR